MPRPARHQQLNRQRVLDLLTDLGLRLQAQGLRARVQIVGGAAISLTLRDNRLTQDVDAVFDHQDAFLAASYEVAKEHGIQTDWIADDVSTFVSEAPAGEMVELALPGLDCFVASPEHLLAMKTRAATTRQSERDAEDLVFLAEHLGLHSAKEVADLTAMQFQGLYAEQLGYDEYLDTAQDAFMVADLRAGRDPLLRMDDTRGHDTDTDVNYDVDQGTFDDTL